MEIEDWILGITANCDCGLLTLTQNTKLKTLNPQAMILEKATLDVKPGRESEFEKDFRVASNIISSMNGYITHELHKCLEKDNRYLLLVQWQTLEDHEIGFRKSPEYQQWKDLLHHYYDPFPTVEHYKSVMQY